MHFAVRLTYGRQHTTALAYSAPGLTQWAKRAMADTAGPPHHHDDKVDSDNQWAKRAMADTAGAGASPAQSTWFKV